MAHIRYNFPCLTCHIDPFGQPYEDPNEDYIFSLNNYTPVGFNPFMNPNGIYDDYYMTCSNLYCHSNGRGTYADPITWSDSEGFCRDPNNSYCLDEDGHFLYCNNCHQTPPDSTDYHSNLDKGCDGCDVCHPHNGIYEDSHGGFYNHVNRRVDIKEVYCDNNMPEEVERRCLECHYCILDALQADSERDSDKSLRHIANSNCLDCHDAVCDPNTIEHYKYKGVLPLSVEKSWNEDTGCGACHHEDHITNDLDKISFKNLKVSHDKITSPCNKCHGEHRKLNIDTIQCTKCARCHIMDSNKRSTP